MLALRERVRKFVNGVPGNEQHGCRSREEAARDYEAAVRAGTVRKIERRG